MEQQIFVDAEEEQEKKNSYECFNKLWRKKRKTENSKARKKKRA
jgi:hypothetical protein|tara:strand:- start:515 stop:646 length:132 start_codon:yes stop_codon:yes gene_type:complete